MDFKQFIESLSVFRTISHNTADNPYVFTDEKLRFLFDIYDADENGKICFEDVSNIFHLIFGSYISNEKVVEVLFDVSVKI